jgi:hypothetical protein
MNQQLLYDLLNRALEEELGLVVTTNNPKALTCNLHELTKGIQKYAPLILTIPSTLETVMIVKRTVELDETGEDHNVT